MRRLKAASSKLREQESRQAQAEREWDVLASALNTSGVEHLAPYRRVRQGLPQGAELFYLLARVSSVRLQEAAIALLLIRPDLAVSARAAIERLEGTERERAMYRYVAAAALQRMWRTRLEHDLGPQSLIPVAYLEQLGLPPLDDDFGRTTLRALAEQEEARYGHNAWAGYTSLIDLILAEISLKASRQRRARAG